MPAFRVPTLDWPGSPPPVVIDSQAEMTHITPGPGRKSPLGLQVFFPAGAAIDKATIYKWRATVSTSESGKSPGSGWTCSKGLVVLRSH